MNRQLLSDISDQERLTRVFGRVMQKGLLAHAYLLTGPSGAGKEALALSFAKLLLCENPYLGEDRLIPCGICAGCLKFDHQTHPDLVVLRPQGAMIKLDQIRDLQRDLSFPPLDSQRRVCLIVEAQKINLPGANALLKTLEEPPAGNHFILTATSVKILLPTIVSRCQVLTCEGLSVEALLERIKAEGLCPPDSAHFLACFSEGSILKAKDLLAQKVFELRKDLFEFLKIGRGKALLSLFVLSKRISGKRDDILLAVQIIRTFLRDLMMLKAISGQGSKKKKEPGAQILFNPDYEKELREISQRFTCQNLTEYCQWLDQVEWMLDRNISREFLAESVLIFWIRRTG
ncbi:MAG: hypothetical protein AVO38_04020 [delta proteobacterium ML8_D]|nr:MAG: hypothetical protein AVO38_04020 [delta proteobacterium ML8_D]